MARMSGLEPHQAGWLARLLYGMVKRKVGKITGRSLLVEPVKITAHHGRLLWAYGQMEMGQEAARTVPAPLKSLASLMAASRIGCPF
jgi:hypothetical protein